jgi:hypothetical protein
LIAAKRINETPVLFSEFRKCQRPGRPPPPPLDDVYVVSDTLEPPLTVPSLFTMPLSMDVPLLTVTPDVKVGVPEV